MKPTSGASWIEVIRKAGHIDALINLAGGFAIGRVVETDASLWHRMLTMNLTAAFLLSKAVLPHMLERRMGRIVHVVALERRWPFPRAAAYIVSKSGLVALIRALALELTGSRRDGQRSSAHDHRYAGESEQHARCRSVEMGQARIHRTDLDLSRIYKKRAR